MKGLLMFSRIALRNVRRNPRRSMLTVFAIAFSLLCLIVFQSLKQGLHNKMIFNAVSIDAGSLQIHAAGYEPNLAYLKPLNDKEDVAAKLRGAGVVDLAYRVKSSALVLAGKKSSMVILTGVDPDTESGVTRISSDMVKGSYLYKEGQVLIGEDLAESMDIGLDEEIAFMVQGNSGLPLFKSFTVGGIYQTGLASFDRSHVYLDLDSARSFLEAGDMVTEIAVKTDLAELDMILAELKEELPADKYQVKAWYEIAPDVKQLIELNNATMGILILIVFAIVAMGIVNTMTTVTFERFRELGTLSAIGSPPGGIISMIVLESFFLGVISMLVGSLSAVIACSYLTKYGIDLTHLTSSNQYFASNHILKADLQIQDLAAANAVTLITAVVAGIYPACKAALLDPVKAILHV